MSIRVLIVDDSLFFQKRLTEIITQDPSLEIVGTAQNGVEALQKVLLLKPDVVTMDVNMPVLDGIGAVRQIMHTHPTPILMISSLTREGANATFDALDAGAIDFLAKQLDSSELGAALHTELRQKIKGIAHTHRRQDIDALQQPSVTEDKTQTRKLEILLIGASTGGPVAVQKLLESLPAELAVPVVVVQHMPGNFTKAYAERLNALCKIEVKEAVHDDKLIPGHAYIAPGGLQIVFERKREATHIRLAPGDPDMHYRPCVDVSFVSAAQTFRDKVLALIFTGMGTDGREGARKLKAEGASVWAQDEASSVVFGMPQAVINAGLADRTFNLDSIGSDIIRKLR